MDIKRFEFTKLQAKIFRLLCVKVGERISQREIAGELRVSPTAVSKALVDLRKFRLVVVEKIGKINLNYVELNRDLSDAIYFKGLENLRMIYVSGLVEDLKDSFPGASILLFGSYSRGEDVIFSDIDIAVVGAKEKKINCSKFEKILKRKININFYPSFRKIHKNLRESILSGVLLHGSIDL